MIFIEADNSLCVMHESVPSPDSSLFVKKPQRGWAREVMAGFFSSGQLQTQLGFACCKIYKQFIDSSGSTLAGHQ